MVKSNRSASSYRHAPIPPDFCQKPRGLRIPGELGFVVRHLLTGFQPADLLHAFRVRLTDRERMVLCTYLCHAHVDRAARQLGTSVQTVRNQLASVRRKLKTKSIPELITKVLVCALYRGWPGDAARDDE
jgi:DNA-binding CsgD family transcriptional regulator